VPFIVAAIVVLAILVVGNLLITSAVLRRLRHYEEQFAAGGVPRSGRQEEVIGKELPEFDGTNTRGEPVSRSSIVGPDRLVAILSAGCSSCHEQAARFARHPDPDRVAIVVLDGDDAAQREALLAAVDNCPTVIAEPASSLIVEAMGVRVFPLLLKADEAGVVVEARTSLTALAASVR
jgi:hypothetical protein